jgi:hypothetical protein
LNLNVDFLKVKNLLVQFQYAYYRVKNLLKSLPEGIRIESVHNIPRDLKPVEITFLQEDETKNIFDIDPIRLN